MPPDHLQRVCFDTNVVLDVLMERPPFVADAARLFDALEKQRLTGFLCATTVTTIDYLVARERGREVARDAVARLLRLFEVAPVTRTVLERALASGFGDYEDAVLHEAALIARADVIVTRNGPDFRAATLPVYAPAELLATFES